MESTSSEKHTDVHPIPVYITTAVDEDEEISLFELWRIIARRKAVILLTFLAALMLASAYIVLVDPVYRADAHLLPPQQQDIQELMIDYDGDQGAIKRYTPELVYQSFLENFKSRGLRREFFDSRMLLKHYVTGKTDANPDKIFDTRFEKNIQVQADSQDVVFVTASFSDSDPQLASKWLNQFVAFANERTVHQLSNNVNVVVQAEIERIRHQLSSKLKLAGQRRGDTIANLQEALQVAKALGIEQPVVPRVTGGKSAAEIAVNTANVPLYTRGTKALEAEISILKSRQSDESFVVGLRDLQEKLAYLEGLSIDPGKLSAVTLDSSAKIPYRAEKPRKALIVVLAVVLGIMIGVFLVFVTEFLSKSSRINQEVS